MENVCFEKLFPTPLMEVDTNETQICDDLSKFIYSWIPEDHGQLFLSSEDELHLKPEFKPVVDVIEKYSEVFFKHIGIDKNNFCMSNMWVNTHMKYGQHYPHIHPNSHFSGVFYLHTPEGSGGIVFNDPRPGRLLHWMDHTEVTDFTDRSWIIPPKVGKLLMFPSWLEHGTRSNKVEETEYRMAISFNYVMLRSTRPTAKVDFIKHV